MTNTYHLLNNILRTNINMRKYTIIDNPDTTQAKNKNFVLCHPYMVVENEETLCNMIVSSKSTNNFEYDFKFFNDTRQKTIFENDTMILTMQCSIPEYLDTLSLQLKTYCYNIPYTINYRLKKEK